jgi:hypothetical protein
MDSIKKKMEKLASETAEAEARIAHFEELKVCLFKGTLPREILSMSEIKRQLHENKICKSDISANSLFYICAT